MSRRSVFIVAVISVVLLGWGRGRSQEPVVADGRLSFALSDLKGLEVTFPGEPFEGKVVYVTLWGTWCPPCLSEVPTLIALQERYRDRGFIVVGIAFEREEDAGERREKLQRFVEKRGINYLVLDGGSISTLDQVLPMMENVKGLPVEILIDRSSSAVSSRNSYGFGRKWVNRLEREILELLSESRR